MRVTRFVTFILLAIPGGTLEAQGVARLEPGTIVRVTYECAEPACRHDICSKQGPFGAVTPDSMMLVGRPVATAIPLSAVTKVEARSGRRVRAGRGVGYPVLGLVVGGLTGYLIGYMECAPCDQELEALAPAVLGLGGAALGFATGLVAGLIPRDTWEDTSFERVRINVAPRSEGGVQFGVSVRF